MVTVNPSLSVVNAVGIPYVTADEAYALMNTELERLFTLLKTLEPQDWSKPTACTLWDVRQIIAHQAGGFASGTGYREFLRQAVGAKWKPGRLIEDAVNDLQVSERAGKSPEELIAEVRRLGPVAAQKWAYQFRLLRSLPFPHPVSGTRPLSYIFEIIHSRDTWMHRLDICRATGRKFEQTANHDGRIVALILSDVEKCLHGKLGERAIIFDLTGVAGGAWKIGRGEPAATIQMDALDFAIFASGRFTYEEARSRASLSGDIAPAENALRQILILF